ncbi:DEAD/DEAH box helicase [Miniimonas arenae]|uniref:DNA 3'-5' helicase n=1 Tax=Miniimonas arenae TaxID=676201 RepID=A0A5C5BGQ2_9MICO|nr:DEAD/DEAH box helicase [Miniimonas arenae]TNU77233.1 DEAD/DEAH box helicase [Miniimonas arenae]
MPISPDSTGGLDASDRLEVPLDEPPYDPEYDAAPPDLADWGGAGGPAAPSTTPRGPARSPRSGGRTTGPTAQRTGDRTPRPAAQHTGDRSVAPTGDASATPPARTEVRAVDVTDVDSPELREEAQAALRALVGRDDAALREDQWRAVHALVAERRRALVVQRTGWGKSAVYFVATALLRARGAGPTVIVSPLLALMRDQVAAAARAGIRAETINSANVTEWQSVHAAIAAGDVDVLLCSPERLNNPGFRAEVLPRLAAEAGLVVVDEAHCVSDWGHDFRPDYRRIRTLLADLPAGTPVLATTATANARVSADVAEQLGVSADTAGGSGVGTGAGMGMGMGAGGGNGPDAATAPHEDVLVLRGSLDRESLRLAVLPRADSAVRVTWLEGYLREAAAAGSGSGIVYCLTVAAAEEVASRLRAAGHEVAAYTGRTDPAEREQLEADLLANRVTALVATSALGMGFDKPDLGFVVHLGAPGSPIAYYQQIGRAGRGVARADVVLEPGPEDAAIWAYFGSLAFPAEETVRTVLDALEHAPDRTASTARLETEVDLRRSRLEMMLSVLDVDGAVEKVRGGWRATGRPWTYDAERYARVARAREDEQAAMLAYERLAGSDACRLGFLRAQLDDPDLTPGWRCGRCDLCAGAWFAPLPDAAAVEEVRVALARAGVEVVPRRQWPTGMATLGVPLAGRIAVEERAEAGSAVARLDGVGLSAAVRDAVGPGAGDGPVPADLRPAVRSLLERLVAERTKIDGVVLVDSTTRPQLVDHLAKGAAHVLGVPVVGRFVARGDAPPTRHDVNSAQRLAAVQQRLELDLSPAAAAGLPGRSVLLVDEYTDSGWTLTLAARLLRLAGARAVHPFVLGVR